jgi:septum formation protein
VAIILASNSRRRTQILENLGLDFFPHPPSPVSEENVLNDLSKRLSERLITLAKAKGAGVIDHHPRHLVVTADTVVVLDEQVFGKPRDRDDAVRMLAALSGKTHRVMTAVCVQRSQPPVDLSGVETTLVVFRDLSQEEIALYVDSVQPYDTAGAYAIQDRGGLLVEKIDGCYFNVIGLPVGLLMDLLRKAGPQDAAG